MSAGPEVDELISQWLAMPRGSEDEKGAAEAFYEERIFPLTVPMVVERSRTSMGGRSYDLLILTLGTSPAPIALSILAVQPTEALLLCTDQTQCFVAKIQRWVGEHGGETAISFERVDASDPLTVYRAVRDHIDSGDYRTVAVDATGGTKAMVSGAAQAAGVLGADLLYVDNEEYLPSLRRPRPGTEFVTRLANPYEVFGDLREREALRLAAQHQYARAADVLGALPDTTQAHVRYELLTYIMRGYAQLESLNLAGAEMDNPEHVKGDKLPTKVAVEGGATWLTLAAGKLATARAQHTAVPFAEEELRGLRRQAGLAAVLGEALADQGPEDKSTSEPPRMLTDPDLFRPLWSFMFNHGLRREECAQFDMAALCIYRCLELLAQRRLAVRGINTALPDYSRLGDVSELAARHREARFGKAAGATLPAKVSLVDGFRLLVALDDPLLAGAEAKLMQMTQGLIESRNQSVFAHGLRFLNPGTYAAFREVVEQWARRLCEVESWNFDEMCDLFRFLDFSRLAER